MASSSNLSDGSNPFAGSKPPSANDLRNLNIVSRIPIRLSHDDSSYYSRKTYFNLVFREYHLREHIDGSIDAAAMQHEAGCSATKATLIHWFILTISKDLFYTVVHDDDDAY